MIAADPRFLRGVDLFNAGEYFDASEEFEELFFEAVRDEVEFVRIFLQVSVGMVHAERRQWRAGVERLEEGVKAIDRTANQRGYDLARLRSATLQAIEQLRSGRRADPYTILRVD
jgi:hypothetical protein